MAMLDFNKMAGAYAQYRDAIPAVINALIAGGAVTRHSRVLEMGCGTANYIQAVHEATGCDGCGLDRSEQMLRYARACAAGIRLVHGDATHLVFADASFDFLFSVDVIHHVASPRAFYAEAYRVLVPGGRICTVTQSEKLIRRTMILSRYFPEAVEINLKRYPRIAKLRLSMEDSGFTGLAEDTVISPKKIAECARYAAKAYSTLHLLPQEAFERGLARLKRDLAYGPITGVQRQTMLWGSKPKRGAGA